MVSATRALVLLTLPLLATASLAQHEDHARMVQQEQQYRRSVHAYEMPDVTLLNQDRQEVRLQELVSSGKPVLVDFIFATCTTICPVLSATFKNFQRELGDEAAEVELVSISIDPEHDRPDVMKRYLQRYGARPGWRFLTGERADIDSAMRAFDCYVPDKMSHAPAYFLRGPGDKEWVRLDGFVRSEEMMAEYRKVAAQ